MAPGGLNNSIAHSTEKQGEKKERGENSCFFNSYSYEVFALDNNSKSTGALSKENIFIRHYSSLPCKPTTSFLTRHCLTKTKKVNCLTDSGLRK